MTLGERACARVHEVAACERAGWPQREQMAVDPLLLGHALATGDTMSGAQIKEWVTELRRLFAACEAEAADEVTEALALSVTSRAWRACPEFEVAFEQAAGVDVPVPAGADLRVYLAAWELLSARALLAVEGARSAVAA